MTLGWHMGSVDGTGFFYKEGGGGGFHCLMRVYPSWRMATVMMTNPTQFDVCKCLDTVDRWLVDRDRSSLHP